MSVQHVKNKPLIIGLTGGIASGKTTAAKFFESLHITIIDSDQIVKELWKHDADMVLLIEETFGYPMDENGKKRLAKDIFQHESLRKKLNAIVHPRVFNEIENLKNSYHDKPIIIIDMPLLIEVGYDQYVDDVLLIYVDRKTQINRLMMRDHISTEEAIMKINSQMSLEEKREFADYIIDNNQDVDSLHEKLKTFLKSIAYEKQ